MLQRKIGNPGFGGAAGLGCLEIESVRSDRQSEAKTLPGHYRVARPLPIAMAGTGGPTVIGLSVCKAQGRSRKAVEDQSPQVRWGEYW